MTEQRVPLFVDPWRRYKKAAKWLLAVVAVYLLFVAAVDWVIPTWYRYRADYYIAKFQKEPSQKLADVLVYLLDQQLLPKAKGDKVLVMLTTPEVRVRESYPAGKDATAWLSCRYDLPFENAIPMVFASPDLSASDQIPSFENFGGSDRRFPRTMTILIPDNGSTNTNLLVDYDCSVSHYIREGGVFGFLFGRFRPLFSSVPLRASSQPSYSCKHSAAIAFNHAQTTDMPVTLVSSADLDKKMSSALRMSLEPVSWSREWSGESEIDYTYKGPLLRLTYRDLPCNVAFRIRLDCDNGERVCSDREYYDLGFQAGTSGSVDLSGFMNRGQLVVDGTRTAVFSLVPDLEVALQYPEMSEIWDGTLSYPITYDITTEGSGRTRPSPTARD